MTVINRLPRNHLLITDALHRLNNVILRHNSQRHQPMADDLIGILDESNRRDIESEKSTIKRLDKAGDIPRVSEELYNPSSNIFDMDYRKTIFNIPWPKELKTTDTVGTDNIVCTSVYRIRYNGKNYAEIKNYHSYFVTDYSVTSMPYPMTLHEEMTSSFNIFGGRLASPYSLDNMDSVGFIRSLSFPVRVDYRTLTFDDSMDSSGSIYSLSIKKQRKDIERLNSYATVYSATILNNKIVYKTTPDNMNSEGYIYAAFFKYP